jgi:hypothetical protein
MTKNTSVFVCASLATLSLLLLPTVTLANPIVPGYTVETYANVSGPTEMTFSPSGTMYVGQDVGHLGGHPWDPARIQRVGIGGAPVEDYGAEISDPDAVIFDATGLFSGTAGSILVGGSIDTNGQGFVSAILPDQSIISIWGPTTVFKNPTKMSYDTVGNLIFTDPTARKILKSGGSFPQVLHTLSYPVDGLAVDSLDRIYTHSQSDGIIRMYDAEGEHTFATLSGSGSAGTLAFGPGGWWGTSLYAISGGILTSIDADGNTTAIGSGFDEAHDIAFGPDGAMYVSMLGDDVVFRIVPEPCTLSLLALGALGLMRRRR